MKGQVIHNPSVIEVINNEIKHRKKNLTNYDKQLS